MRIAVLQTCSIPNTAQSLITATPAQSLITATRAKILITPNPSKMSIRLSIQSGHPLRSL
jgi:hypothetical protein